MTLVVEYDSVIAENLKDLAAKVTRAIAKGWQLHGGIQILFRKRYKELYADDELPYEEYFEYTQFLIFSHEEKKMDAPKAKKNNKEPVAINEKEFLGAGYTKCRRNRKNRTRRHY